MKNTFVVKGILAGLLYVVFLYTTSVVEADSIKLLFLLMIIPYVIIGVIISSDCWKHWLMSLFIAIVFAILFFAIFLLTRTQETLTSLLYPEIGELSSSEGAAVIFMWLSYAIMSILIVFVSATITAIRTRRNKKNSEKPERLLYGRSR